MTERVQRVRQIVDWKAAIWSGVIGGLLFLLIAIALPGAVLGDPWLVTRILASIVLGPSVIPPQDTLNAMIPLTALATSFVLAILFACIVAFIIHREGIILGFFGGALIGLALYAINFYAISYFFPWIYHLRNWFFIIGHVVFGAVVGALYELLEEEKFVPIET